MSFYELSVHLLDKHIFSKGYEHHTQYLHIKGNIISTTTAQKSEINALFKNNSSWASYDSRDHNQELYEEYSLEDESYIKIYQDGFIEPTDEGLFAYEFHNIKLVDGDILLNNRHDISQLTFKNCQIGGVRYANDYMGHNFTIDLNQVTASGDIRLSGSVAIKARGSRFSSLVIADSKIVKPLEILDSKFEHLTVRSANFARTPSFSLKPESLKPDNCILIQDCEGQGPATIHIENIDLLAEHNLSIKRLRGFSEVCISEPMGFAENSHIHVSECDLTNFKIDVLNPRYLELENVSWALSPSHLFDPLMPKLRTIRTNGFKVPKQIQPSDRLKYAHYQERKYIELRQHAKSLGDKHLEDEFYYSQMYWALKNRFNLHNYLYKAFCGYGLSSFSPMLSYTFCFILFALIYMGISIQHGQHLDFSTYWLISLSGSIALFDYFGQFKETIAHFSENGKFWLYLAFYIERAVQFFFIFEFGASIRNAVKK